MAEIKRAYRRLARQWHPDRNPAPGAEARFVEISAAYELLTDPRKRALHDHTAGDAGRGPGVVPLSFLQDFTDAVERAERLVLEWMMARYLRAYRRGRGVELVARLAADLVDGAALAVAEDPGRWARWRARRRLAGLEVDIDYDRVGPPSRVEGRRGRWRLTLVPASFWIGGTTEPADLDEAVAQHVAGQLVVALAVESGARWLLLAGRPGAETTRRARGIDDAFIRRRQWQVLGWLVFAAVSAAMLWAGYASRL